MSILVTLTQPAGATGAIEELDPAASVTISGARAALIKGAAYRQQLNFGAEGDQALDRIKYVHQMGTVGADRCYSNPSPPV